MAKGGSGMPKGMPPKKGSMGSDHGKMGQGSMDKMHQEAAKQMNKKPKGSGGK